MTITAEHSSGRYDVPPAVLKAALLKQLADKPDFLSLTEMMSEARAAVLDELPGYFAVRAKGSDGADECALLLQLGGRYRVAWFRPVRLSELPIPRRDGKLCYALHVYLENVETGQRHHRIIVHMPSGVEGAEGLLSNAQAKVYSSAISGLAAYATQLEGAVVVTGDWNLTLRKPWVRAFLTRHFPGFRKTWARDALPELGTHGSRVIDYSLIRGFSVTAAQVVSSFGASDHRAIRETQKEIHMANRYPAASWEPLGAQTEDRMTAHDIVCIHTMVGSLRGTDSMFEGDGFGGTESHFGTGGAGEKVKQWQDIAFTADANLNGNPRVLSIENADKGPGFPEWAGSNVPAFTELQLDQLVNLVAWLCSKEAHSGCPATWKCHQEGIPAVLIPDSKPGRRGIGYHRQGINGSLPDMRVTGGELWSESTGKICPGDRRVAQTKNILIPRVADRLKLPAPVPPAKTPNITAFRTAETHAERVAAARAVVANSANDVAVKAANAWLVADERRTAAARALVRQEVQ